MSSSPPFIKLRDGRRLGFAEYGKPDGVPVFGFFGATARYVRPSDEQTAKTGVRLITVERPGFGQSDPKRGRRLLDWPADILELAEALGLDKFAVIGGSQGGPYAAACAYAIPDRLTAVSLVSSLAPFEAPGVMEGMAGPLKMLPKLANGFPALLNLMQALTVPLVRRNPGALFKQTFRGLPETDQAVFRAQPEIEQLFLKDAPEIYRQGGQGVAGDIRVVCRPWGFRLEDIRARVYLWQGESDPNVPPAMGRYLARTIPNCRATFVPGAGHFLIYSRWPDILGQLVAPETTP